MEESIFNKIQTKLIEEENMSLVMSAIMTADIVNQYDAIVRTAIISWAEGKDVTGFSIDDTGVTDIMAEINCSVFQALCILNGIHKNPECFMDAVFVSWKDDVIS